MSELDARIAKDVMGRRVTVNAYGEWLEFYGDYPNGFYAKLRPYSTEIQVAWRVVERMQERGYAASFYVCDDGYVAEFRHVEETEHATATRVDPREGGMPLAICKAALAALDTEQAGAK